MRLIACAALAVAVTVLPGSAQAPPTEITIRADQPGATINRNIYGHFAEHLGRLIYDGIWVGEGSSIPNTRGIRNDVVAALKKLNIPVLRWPGGCFADEYHWRDGIGPRQQRPKRLNTNWGGVVETNAFGTHEFMDLAEQIGADPYISANVGSGTPQEMMEWVEYMTSDADTELANLRRRNGREKPWRVPYFGVGNESWGCGGNMRPEYYADEYRRFSTFVKNYSGNRITKIASGSNGEDYNWTEVLMSRAARKMNGLSLHYYTLPTGDWNKKGSATQFGEAEWHATLARTLRMEELVRKHSAIMDKYDAGKRVGLMVDEWGTWYDVEPGTPGSSLPAEQPARRRRRGHQPQHLQPARRSRADGQHRADRQRAAGDDPDERREDGAHADVSRLRDVQGPPGRDIAAGGDDRAAIHRGADGRAVSARLGFARLGGPDSSDDRKPRPEPSRGRGARAYRHDPSHGHGPCADRSCHDQREHVRHSRGGEAGAVYRDREARRPLRCVAAFEVRRGFRAAVVFGAGRGWSSSS